MSLFSSQNQKHLSLKHKQKRLTQDQVGLLEASFNPNNKLNPEHKHRLACQLGVPPRQIAIWYQNKRARWKSQSLELDYGAVQLRLETALAEKRRLERDVQRLREELEKSQEMLNALNQAVLPPAVCSLSNSGGGGRMISSSGLQNDVKCSWVNDEALRLEELYLQ
ncbi:hypothetical protein F0562_008966 [Nyssa sinensis]|uniref:Homeobox-leucine zipper protein n=1 Tax=Nyssa sinensis TaxID=561372 RepID=A0A5J5A6S3_9ASTE|nr:hypothetical protein F0562_008966 [Nyssa sinensis]